MKNTSNPSADRSHRKMAEAIFEKGLAYRDFTPAHSGDSEKSGAQGTWLFNPGMRELSPRRERPARRRRRAFCLALSRSARDGQTVRFTDAVYGEQVKAGADIEDFALLRSDGMPTYHLASCADDADLRISHIIRGQDHLSNTFKHVLIFEAAGYHTAAVRASAAAGRAGWNQAFEATPRAGRQRDDLSRCGISAGGVHQFPLPAGLVAEKRSRADVAGRN